MNISNCFNAVPDYLKKAPTRDEVIIAILSIASRIIAGAYVAYPNVKTSIVTISVGITFGLTISTIDSILKRYFTNKKEQRLLVIDQEIQTKSDELEKLTTNYLSHTQPDHLKKKEAELRKEHAAGLQKVISCERHIEKFEDDLEAKANLLTLKNQQTILYKKISDCRDEHPEIAKLKDDLAKLQAEKLSL